MGGEAGAKLWVGGLLNLVDELVGDFALGNPAPILVQICLTGRLGCRPENDPEAAATIILAGESRQGNPFLKPQKDSRIAAWRRYIPDSGFPDKKGYFWCDRLALASGFC